MCDVNANLPAGRTLLLIVAISYLVSAVMLVVARWRGVDIGWLYIAGWVVTGVAGAALATQLAPARPAVWVALALVLLPWMLFSLVVDVRLRFWLMVAIDVAGVLAIVYGLALARSALSAAPAV